MSEDFVIANPDLDQEAGVYEIVHPDSGYRYVGSTEVSFRKRRIGHLTTLRRGKHHSEGLQLLYDAFGAKSLEFRVLEVVTPPTREALEEAEARHATGDRLLNGAAIRRGRVLTTKHPDFKRHALYQR